MMMITNSAFAELDENKLCQAIFIAEGGNKTKFPYGILKKYKNTSPKQACLNSVRHRYRDWVKEGSKGDFISYLQKFYAPIGASNDPQGLNRNFQKNVRVFYGKV